MKQVAYNTFSGGLVQDVDNLLHKANTTSVMHNIRFVARDNTVMIATNLLGTAPAGTLTANYYPIGIASKDGVAYIISAEIINSSATGRGEIGTYGGPAYTGTTGSLVTGYQPLKNYSGDSPTNPKVYGNFRSIYFAFTLTNELDIELQTDYDGSVNIIFTDGINPMRIINSGFTVLPAGNYQIVDRSGEHDTNKYDKEHFGTIINLIQKSKKIMRVEFGGLKNGGRLKGGNYSYYFKYATRDWNETDVIAHSGLVSVFHGEKIVEIRGAKGDGEEVNKSVQFTLGNCDQSYSYIIAYIVYTTGLDNEIRQAFKITDPIIITGSTVTFTHTGFENITTIDPLSLNDDFANIDTAYALAQHQGILFAGRVKTTNRNSDILRDWARTIRISHIEQKLHIPNTGELSTLYSASANQTAIVRDGWDNGYYNPMNIYKRLGYMGGEAYPFRIVFIFSDGSISDAYPLLAYDNSPNTLAPATVYVQATSCMSLMDSSNGYYPTTGSNTIAKTSMLNINGVYRFPNRDKTTDTMVKLTDNSITILGVKFKIPTITQGILNATIGCFFVRGKRKADAIIQGNIINTVAVPNFDYVEMDNDNYYLSEYNFLENNSTSIPAYRYCIEAQEHYPTMNGDKFVPIQHERGGGYLLQMYYHVPTYNGNNYPKGNGLYRNKKFALLSSDIILNKAKIISTINDRDTKLHFLYKVNGTQSVQTRIGDAPSNTSGWSMIRTNGMAKFTPGVNNAQTLDAKTSWVEGNSKLVNYHGFSSAAYFESFWKPNNGDIIVTNVSYNDYIGLWLKNDAIWTLANPLNTSPDDRREDCQFATNQYRVSTDSMALVNVYPNGGQRDIEAVKAVYGNADMMEYFPITERMYWNASVIGYDPSNILSNKLVGDELICYGGDTYIGATYRKLFFSASDIKDFQEADDEAASVHLGYTICFFNESDHNPALRNEERYNINELSDRTFFPYDKKLPPDFADQNDRGDGIEMRDTERIPESNGYNKGYGVKEGSKIYIGYDSNAPYVKTNWFARIWHTSKHIPNSFTNQFRQWGGDAYQDYDSAYGPIVALRSLNNHLYCIQEHSIGLVPINERIQTGSDSAGPIFVEAISILPPVLGRMTENIGAKYKSSIVSSNSYLYGYDGDSALFWQVNSIEVKNISLFKIGSTLIQKASNYRDLSTNIYAKNVEGFFDIKNSEIIFSMRSTKGNITFAYFEPMDVFTTNDIIPDKLFHIYNDSYACKNGTIWRLDSEGVYRCNFFNVQKKCKIGFIVNEFPQIDKIFDNLIIISNNLLPETIRYDIQGAYTIQTVVNNPTNIHLSNAKYRDERVEVMIPRASIITNADAGNYLHGNPNMRSLVSQTARMRGKYMMVEIEYNTQGLLRLQSVLTMFRNSIS